MGLFDRKIGIHIEFTKDPVFIDEAIHEVITFLEIINQHDEQYFDKQNKHFVRQVRRTEKDTSD